MSSYYLLPKGNIQLSNCFQIEYSETPPQNILSPSLTHYLGDILNNERINTDLFCKLRNDNYKKIINNKYCPEFFEIFEIIQTMNLNVYLDTFFKTIQLQIFSFDYNNNTKIPGSFAFQKKIETNNVKYYNSVTYNLKNFENIYLDYAAKNHVIIANRIINSNKEMLIMICLTLCIQCKKGIFIWKIGDSYTHFFLEIIYFLSSFYERIYIIKPSIIDISTPYKYIVCKGFLHENSYSIYTYLYSIVKYIDKNNNNNNNRNSYIGNNNNNLRKKNYISSFLNVYIPNFFLSKFEEVNYILGQSQLEQLHYLLLLYDKHTDNKII